MRVLWIPLALVLVAVDATPVAAESEGQVGFFLGRKSLTPVRGWHNVEDQPEFGAFVTLGRSGWPVSLALDVLRSRERADFNAERLTPGWGTQTDEGTTLEVAAGLRKVWGSGATHPYVGGGVVWIDSSMERRFSERPEGNGERNESALGGWLNGGVAWRLGQRFNLGFDLRWSYAEFDVDFGQNHIQVGGVHGGITLGFGW